MKQPFSIPTTKYLIFLLVLLGECSCREKQEALVTGLEGKPMPAFNLLSVDSTTYINSSTVGNNKPSIVFFFSGTCPYCRAQMKNIIRNIQSFKDDHLYLVTNSIADIKTFEDRYKLKQYTNITIGIDSAYSLQNYYNVNVVPYLAIFNKEKKLTKAFTGITSIKQMTGALKL